VPEEPGFVVVDKLEASWMVDPGLRLRGDVEVDFVIDTNRLCRQGLLQVDQAVKGRQ
jgi:hypothetical protein